MKLNLRSALFGAALALPLGALPGLTLAEDLTVVMSAPLRTLDPTSSTARIVRSHGFMVFDTLLGLDENMAVQPEMASYTVSDDNLVYTFTLRDGLMFHDGTAVTAEDCIASIRRWAAHDGAGGKMLTFVEKMEATSDKGFTITLSAPFGQLPDLLAKPSPIPAFMLPKRLADTPAGEQITDMVGSGPFRFVADEFQPGVRAVYEKFEDYVPREEPASGNAGGKVVNFDRVIWEVMPDIQTAINALQAGDVDYLETLPTDLVPLVEMAENVDYGVIKPVGSQVTGQFNHLIPPFDNPEVRRAAMYALDQEQILMTAIGNPEYYSMCASIYGCTVPLASDAGSEYLQGTADERMAKAKDILAASGYDGTPVVMLQPTDLAILQTPPIVAAELLRKAGFTVEVESMDWATLSSRRTSQAPAAEGGWNMFFTYWGVEGIWNPLASVLIDGTGEPGAWSGWRKSDEVEKLRVDYIAAPTLEEQKDIAVRIQQIVYDDGFYFNGGEFLSLSAWSSDLDGIVPGMVNQFWGIHR
ncbi:ABC transporter substrate-binding protein [Albibacillus kandeliae]|uniref:ABC transporter substrate-binding protein n=1 Tax=Albibacillus kandeliae TaxID=2174228 RepID=UPI000D6998BA|nr:ABC transporter substrate-binding protein [Albibacillus kandeliae]